MSCKASELQLRLMMDNSPVAARIETLDDNVIVYANPAYLELVKVSRNTLEQMDASHFYADAEDYRSLLSQVGRGQTVRNRMMEMVIPGEQKRWMMTSYLPIQFGGRAAVLVWYADITELKEHQDQLEFLAQFDDLTGLPNRMLLRDRFNQTMNQARRRGQPIALVFVDLDGFKAVNDRFGYDAGDALLTILARRMQDTLRDSDTIARFGGDEFFMVLADPQTAEDSLALVERVLACASKPVRYQGNSLQVSASLGITYYPQVREISAEELLNQADEAMYQAKQAGKNRYAVFRTEPRLRPVPAPRSE